MNILIIVNGGIAAYKICDVVGLLKKRGADVRVVMTRSAKEFIGPITFATLSENKVYEGDFGNDGRVLHVELAKWADKVLVAPATYNFIGKIASGLADDLASTIIAAVPVKTKVFIAPAMNTNMWEKPILKKNIKMIEALGQYIIIPPREAMLACGDRGIGALEKPIRIVETLIPKDK